MVLCFMFQIIIQVESHKLRYVVGAILSEDGSEIDELVQHKLVQCGYKVAKLPSVTYAVNTTFPYRSALSILIAVWRVYPRMHNYVKVRLTLLTHVFFQNKHCFKVNCQILESSVLLRQKTTHHDRGWVILSGFLNDMEGFLKSL